MKPLNGSKKTSAGDVLISIEGKLIYSTLYISHPFTLIGMVCMMFACQTIITQKHIIKPHRWVINVLVSSMCCCKHLGSWNHAKLIHGDSITFWEWFHATDIHLLKRWLWHPFIIRWQYDWILAGNATTGGNLYQAMSPVFIFSQFSPIFCR